MTGSSSSGTATVTTPTETTILITREFDAPRELIWKAWTTPELIRRWWTAGRGDMTVCEVDLRPGGRWRFAMNATDGGFEVGFHGEYRELDEPGRLVSTEVFEGLPHLGMPGGEALNTLTLSEADGRTTLTILVEHANQADRDGHINSGMEHGLQDALDRVEEIARELAG